MTIFVTILEPHLVWWPLCYIFCILSRSISFCSRNQDRDWPQQGAYCAVRPLVATPHPARHPWRHRTTHPPPLPSPIITTSCNFGCGPANTTVRLFYSFATRMDGAQSVASRHEQGPASRARAQQINIGATRVTHTAAWFGVAHGFGV